MKTQDVSILSTVGTLILIAGAVINSLNIYPMGIIVMSFGSLSWLMVGVFRKDKQLAITNGVMIVISLVGVILNLLNS